MKNAAIAAILKLRRICSHMVWWANLIFFFFFNSLTNPTFAEKVRSKDDVTDVIPLVQGK